MYTFVTSFNKESYNTYGLEMLKSVSENWKTTAGMLRLVVYVEGFDSLDELPEHEFSSVIEYRHLEHVEARTVFLERNSDKNGTLEGGHYNYRMDAARFCHKVYAFSDLAFELISDDYRGWLVWLDADTVTTKEFTAGDAAKLLPESKEVVHLGRIDIDYSETGFVGWNLNMHNAASLITDMRGAYDTDEIFGYREWTDAFLFERLLNIYKAHGMEVLNLSEGVRGLAVFENSPLKDFFVHKKGNLKFVDAEPAQPTKQLKGAKRYKQLADIVRHYSEDNDNFSILEVGTWDGRRAIEMALAAFESVDKVHYRGFDLFEDATDETDKVELNVKKHNTISAISERLQQFSDKMSENNKEFTFSLHKGDTKDTLKGSKHLDVDLAYIDGGHSYETVKSDYDHLSSVPVVVFDDYYSPMDEDTVVSEDHTGIIKTFKDIKVKRKAVLPSEDPTTLGWYVHLAIALQDSDTVKDLPTSLTRVPIIVKPKDSMPVDDIRNNVRENVKLINNFDWVKNYKPTEEHAIIVSGGKLDFIKIKKLQQETNAKVFCVKHSYQRLLKNGIKPFACVVLDPRPMEGVSTHGVVRKDLFKKIDPTTKFFIASMTDITVTKYIMEKTDNILGFHAFTDAIRDETVTNKVTIAEGIGINPGELLISGGTCAATRTIGLLETLGYTNQHLFGFDCSVTEKEAKKHKDIKDEAGNDKYLAVETGDKKFFTTGELLALAQDLERMFEDKACKINFKFYGSDSLAAQVFEQSYYNEHYKTFDQWLN